MIRMLNAYTAEIDEAESALSDILSQIDLGSLEKNSAGILSCHYEFVETGVAQEIGRRLPFDVIGFTTIGSSVCGSFEVYQLSLTVFTSNDVWFSTAGTAPIWPEDYEHPLESAYKGASSALAGSPSLIISFLPYIFDISSAAIFNSFDKISGGAPIFGAVACESSTDGRVWTIRNEQSYTRAVQMLLMYGDVKPEFYTISIPIRNIRQQRAVVTESDGVVIKKVNDMLPMEYFASIGIDMSKNQTFVNMPLLIDYGYDSQPSAVGIYSIVEDGGAVCGGNIPQGVSFSICAVDREGIMETAQAIAQKALNTNAKTGFLMFSCITRYLMLNPNSEDEAQLIAESICQEMPYALGYAGGEICPVYNGAGELHNRFHNYSFIMCVL